MTKYPRLGGDQPKVRYNVQWAQARGFSLFLSFDQKGELLGWSYLMDTIHYAFNTAADGSIIGMGGGAKPRPRLFIAKVFYAEQHPDFNATLAKKYGKAAIPSVDSQDGQRYDWRGAYAVLWNGKVPGMKHLTVSKGAANKAGVALARRGNAAKDPFLE